MAAKRARRRCIHRMVRRLALPDRVRFIGNIGFFATRFRPVVERKTDISIFEKILDKARSNDLEMV